MKGILDIYTGICFPGKPVLGTLCSTIFPPVSLFVLVFELYTLLTSLCISYRPINMLFELGKMTKLIIYRSSHILSRY